MSVCKREDGKKVTKHLEISEGFLEEATHGIQVLMDGKGVVWDEVTHWVVRANHNTGQC